MRTEPKKLNIYRAIINNDLQELEKCIKSGCDINQSFPDAIYGTKTCIELTAEYDSLETLEFLVNNGYDLQKKESRSLSQFDLFVRTMRQVSGHNRDEALTKMTVFFNALF